MCTIQLKGLTKLEKGLRYQDYYSDLDKHGVGIVIGYTSMSTLVENQSDDVKKVLFIFFRYSYFYLLMLKEKKNFKRGYLIPRYSRHSTT